MDPVLFVFGLAAMLAVGLCAGRVAGLRRLQRVEDQVATLDKENVDLRTTIRTVEFERDRLRKDAARPQPATGYCLQCRKERADAAAFARP